jgi:adenine phosphoribosyltransferase
MNMTDADDLIRSRIRTVPDWPKPGILFRDITPALQDAACLRAMVQAFVRRYARESVTLVAGIDARGFILGSIIAYELDAGFIPVRKAGKLPFKSIGADYALEYGQGRLELNVDAAKPGDRVLVVDDLIATGGTMSAARRLIEQLGATVVEGAAIIDLPDLGGSARLRAAGLPLFTLLAFPGH